MTRVPLTSQQRIGQDLVRLLHAQEPFAIPRGRVGMEALGQLAVSSLDLRLGRVTANTERAVWIEGLCHQLGRFPLRPRSAELGQRRQLESRNGLSNLEPSGVAQG